MSDNATAAVARRPLAAFAAGPGKPAAIALLAVCAVLYPIVFPNQANVDSLANAAIYAALALGLNIVVGFTGLLDLGYAAFFAIGAYAYGILNSFQLHPAWGPFWVPLQHLGLVMPFPGGSGGTVVHFTLSFWIALPLSAVISAACGMAFGAPTLRLRGDYLAIVTLGFGEIVPIVFRNWASLTNGAAGLNGVGAPVLLGHSFGVNAIPYYYVAIALVAFLIFASLRLRDSRIGRAWMAIREDEIAAGAMILQLLQSWWLPDLSGLVDGLGRLIGNRWLASVDLTQSIELIFGIILVVMMLYRRQGLIPASRPQAALSFEAQHAVVQRGFGELHLSGLAGDDAPGAPALEVRDVTVAFGGLKALDRVSLDVPAGGVVAVIGPNGSGKSTLFNLITGLVPANGGSIRFRGEEILGLHDHQILARGIARTFQNIRLFPTLTVLQNVMVGQHARLSTGAFGAIFRPPGTRREERAALDWAREIVAIFGNRLAPRLGQAVGGLSYANRRRTEIARALASRPKLLLLDEPTAGMNPAETLELAEQIRGLKSLGLTVLLIEHKLDVVTQLADTVYVLDHGEIIAHGTPAEVRRNEDVLRAYLGRNAQAAAAGIAGGSDAA